VYGDENSSACINAVCHLLLQVLPVRISLGWLVLVMDLQPIKSVNFFVVTAKSVFYPNYHCMDVEPETDK